MEANMKHLKTFYKKWFQLLVVIVISFISGALGSFSIAQLTQKSSVSNSNNNSTITQTAYKNENSTTQAVNKVKDAVVSVITYSANRQNSVFGNDDTDTDSNTEQINSEGSGVIYKKDGKEAYIVTNNHVVDGAKKLEIMLSDGSKITGELVGKDTYSDLAVVKVSSDKIKTVAEFADSNSLTVGEKAIAIGSPLGTEYANSVTEGIVSSLSRTVTMQNDNGETVSTNAIQTDAAINPGNSGGALVNIEGQVIGINSSKISSTSAVAGSAVEGMGFAIPSNDVVEIINQLEKDGKVTRPALGISMADLNSLSSSTTSKLDLPDEVKSGVVVGSVQKGMPADGKLQENDVITEIDGKEISSKTDIQTNLYSHSIGDTIKVTFYRGKEKKTEELKLTKSTEDLSD